MKNAVIVLLSVLCLFFILNALGTFQFGSIIERDYRLNHEKERIAAVNKSSEFNIAVLYDKEDRPAYECILGAETAVKMINSQNGILRKKVNLIKEDNYTNLPGYNSGIQKYCESYETSLVLGPFSSGYIPSARALTQYQGLPLISPLTVTSEKLPKLEPDNFVTFFPPLEMWGKAILKHMVEKGCNNLLIISPETDSYGDIFCTAIERASRRISAFERVYRLNYQTPLSGKELIRSIQNYRRTHAKNVFFFGGTYSDFPEFKKLLKDLNIEDPVYGSDDLYIPAALNSGLPGGLFLPHAVMTKLDTPFLTEWKKEHDHEPSFHTALGGETMLAVAKVLKEQGKYNIQDLINGLRTMSQKLMEDQDTAPKILIEGVFSKQ